MKVERGVTAHLKSFRLNGKVLYRGTHKGRRGPIKKLEEKREIFPARRRPTTHQAGGKNKVQFNRKDPGGVRGTKVKGKAKALTGKLGGGGSRSVGGGKQSLWKKVQTPGSVSPSKNATGRKARPIQKKPGKKKEPQRCLKTLKTHV